ncbi:MAG TPA: ribonuclease T2 [Methylovirgula sp.]|nr:ribonuclease T2 [Methylovirgula sp.]
MPAFFGAVLALFFAVLATGAAAQGSGCILDNCADRKPLTSPAPSSGSRADAGSHVDSPGDFDFYVLALSWSPGFCDTNENGRARAQCESGAHLGFVVHGLWPQYQHGFPEDCGGISSPSYFALQSVQGLYPDEGLARYEWRKHGTCSGKSPSDYFADVRKARAAINIPPQFSNANEPQTWTPLDIQRAFIAANPRMRPGMMAIECVRGELEEVRICMSKDLRNFVACPEVARHFCYGQQVSVPPMR